MKRPTLHLFDSRNAKEKKRLEDLAAELPPGAERLDVLRELRRMNTERHIDEWASSPCRPRLL
jgi:hypothetical protein